MKKNSRTSPIPDGPARVIGCQIKEPLIKTERRHFLSRASALFCRRRRRRRRRPKDENAKRGNNHQTASAASSTKTFCLPAVVFNRKTLKQTNRRPRRHRPHAPLPLVSVCNAECSLRAHVSTRIEFRLEKCNLTRIGLSQKRANLTIVFVFLRSLT